MVPERRCAHVYKACFIDSGKIPSRRQPAIHEGSIHAGQPAIHEGSIGLHEVVDCWCEINTDTPRRFLLLLSELLNSIFHVTIGPHINTQILLTIDLKANPLPTICL